MATDQIHCLHILLKHTGSRRPQTYKGTPVTRSKDEARTELEKLRAEIVEGKLDFSAAAKQFSDCSSAQKGGDLGKFGRNTMLKPFEDAAFALAVGEVSGIVDSDSGLHIIKRVA